MSLFRSATNSFSAKSVAANASFVGTFELVYDFHGIISNAIATNPHKIEVQFSDDAAAVIKTVDISDDNHIHVEAIYFRIKFTNLGLTTDIVDVHTYLSQNAISTSSIALQSQQVTELTAVNTKLAGVLHVNVDNQATGLAQESTQVQAKDKLTAIDSKLGVFFMLA